ALAPRLDAPLSCPQEHRKGQPQGLPHMTFPSRQLIQWAMLLVTMAAFSTHSRASTAAVASAAGSIVNCGPKPAIQAGWSYSMALKPDGTVWAWGCCATVGGRAGDQHTPVQVASL